MATFDTLISLTHPLPDQVAACLRTEADVLEAAVAEGESLDAETAVPMITLALEGAGLAIDQARACALLLAEAVLPPVGPLDEVWKGLRNSIMASGKMELGSGEVKYLVARVVRGLGAERETARGIVCTLATAAGLRVRESATASNLGGSVGEPPASSSLALESQSAVSVTVGASVPPGEKLRQALRDAAPGAEIRLPAGEFEGPFELARAIKLIGQGEATTLWARRGPVVVVKAGGVTLGDLLIEVTAEPDGVALRNEAPQEPRLDRVTLKGRTEGFAAGPSPGGTWNLPVAIDFGTLPPKTTAERVVDLETPGPGTAHTPLAGVQLEPAGLPGGPCRLRVILDGGHLHSGTMVMGDVEITCGVERRSIPLSATVQSSVTSTAPSTPVASAPLGGTVGGPTTARRRLGTGKPSSLVLVGGACGLVVALTIVLLNYSRQDRPPSETIGERAQRQQAGRPTREPRAGANVQRPQTQTNARREEQKQEGVAIQKESVEQSGVGPQRRTQEARRQDQPEPRLKGEKRENLPGESQIVSTPEGAETKSAKVYYEQAVQRYKQGDLAGARADLDQVITLDPKNSRAYHDRGFLRSKQADLTGARADYDQAIALDPKYAMAYYNRGLVRQKQGDPIEAVADLDQAVALDPKIAISGHPGKQIAMSVAEEVRDFARKNGLDPMKVGDYVRAMQLLENSKQYGAAARFLKSAKAEIEKQLKTGW